MNKISGKRDTTVLLLVLTVVLAFVMFWLLWSGFERGRQHTNSKIELIVLSNDVLHNNNSLIRYMRTYVFSRDEQYLERYLELLGDYESFQGKLDRMNEIGLNDFEIGLIGQIEEIWAQLEEIEKFVIDSMAAGNYEDALAKIYSSEYMNADLLLADMIDMLITDVEDRNAEITQQLDRQLQTIIIVFSSAYLLLTLALFVVFRNNRKLRDTYKSQKEDFENEAATLQYIFDSLPVAVRIISTEDYSLLYANRAIRKLFGGDPDKDISHLNMMSFLPEKQPDGRPSIDIVRELAGKDLSTVEITCVKMDGSEFLARSSTVKTVFRGKPAALATIEDLTAEQEHREMLKNIAQREQEANQLKSRFLAMMSHEIRTPMNAIMGIAEIQIQNGNLSEETEAALERIYESGNLLLNIINDILDLSKIEAGKLEIHPVKYDIPSLINDTIQLTKLRYESSPIEFFIDVDESTPLNLIGDELRIKQVLNNILSNAFKYTHEGKVKLSVHPEETVPAGDKDKVVLVYKISDTGQGMTEDQLAVLFEEYTRFNLDANRATVGTGLGMSITKRLLDLMDGEISVKSDVDMGTTFTVRIPQRRVDSLVCGAQMSERLRNHDFRTSRVAKKGAVLREYMPYGSVLVVDDVETNIYVTRGMLLPYGLKVDTAANGFAAIDKVREGREYDIIFMDHMMPLMDGIETVKKLRDMGYGGNIVALTANALVGHADMFLQNGFDGYISKPIDSRELNQVLNEMIRDKQPEEEIMKARSEQKALRKENRRADAPAGGMAKAAMRKHFVIDARSALDSFEKLVSQAGEVEPADLKEFKVTAHAIKSSLRNIGEIAASVRAYELEIAAGEEDYALLSGKTPAFIDDLRALAEKYEGI